MKFIQNIFDKVKPNFEKGGKLEKFHPAFEAFETLMFVPSATTQKGAHIRDAVDLKRTMITVVLALLPALLFGMYNVGYQHFSQLGQLEEQGLMGLFTYGLLEVLPLIVVSYGVGLGVEFAFAISRGHSINEGYLVSGMLIPLIVPVDVPLWMLAIAVIFAVVIGKEVFGGTGMNILNPALTARAFLFFAYPTQMSGDKVWVSEAANIDAISGETILGQLAGNKEVTTSIADMFYGFVPGSVGETSVLAILLGAALLICSGIGSWRIMLSTLVGGSIIAMLFNAYGNNALQSFDWVSHLLVGGFMFGAVFMATDPVTATQTTRGKWIYGLLIGVLAMLIRIINPAYPEGMMMAIIFMNIMAPLIDHYVVEANIKRRLKRVKSV